MRLIDADELKKECCSVPDPKGRYSELKIIEDYEIDDAPTVFDIPNNPTNGEVIKAVFPQWKIIDDTDKDMIMFNIPMKVGYEFNACSREWWNSLYE